jgi:TldD protein
MKDIIHRLSRRDFIKQSALGGLALATVPSWGKGLLALEEKGEALPFIDHFGVSQEDMQKVLSIALSRGGDFAELFFDYRLRNSISLEEHIVKSATQGITMGVGIRVLSDEKSGYAYAEELTFDKMKEAALAAAMIASGPAKVKTAAISPKKTSNLYPILLPAHKAEIEDKLKQINDADNTASQYDPRIKKVSVFLSDEIRYIIITNSEGLFAKDTQPMIRFAVNCIAEEKGNRRSVYEGQGGRLGMEIFKKRDARDIAKKAAETAVKMLDAKDAPAGLQTVVLANGDPAVIIHEAVGHGLEADFNRKKTSAFADRIGDKVASGSVTIKDGGVFQNLSGSINVDDEGTDSHDTLLIENGVLRGYMQDLLSARIMKAKPTGNGRRQDFTYMPIPRMTNTYMAKGTSDPEEIIKSVKKGVYAKSFAGGQVDITNGKFVFMAIESYLIEDGKITAPIKDATLIGDGPSVLTKIDMVGNDFKWSSGLGMCGKDGQGVPAGMGMPTARISELLVGGTSKG